MALRSQDFIPVFFEGQFPVCGLEKFGLNFSRYANCDVAPLSFALYYTRSTLLPVFIKGHVPVWDADSTPVLSSVERGYCQ